MIRGQDKAIDAFLRAWRGGTPHHAWLLAGPKGVGKASFARAAAARVLAEAASHVGPEHALAISPDTPTVRFIDGEAHPDFKLLEREMNKAGTALARNISVDQVRALAGLFGQTPALGDWRAVVIDSLDDLEKGAANALLKMLEEPPPNCLFLLVSHAPGRLLPTVRSRCRRLEFQPLADDVMAALLAEQAPGAPAEPLIAASGGSIGRALALATLDLAPLRDQALGLMREGDPANARRSKLASTLGARGAGDRYAAFLDLVPSLIAAEARRLDGPARIRALDAYAAARDEARLAPRLSLDPATTAFRLGSILASIAPPGAAR
jgi:DNA polymerase-3 subunit delta'